MDARVTRDVMAARTGRDSGRSRVRRQLVLVERGGKVKERARLGVRFHTLVLSDGTRGADQTEAIYREGESPAGDSAKKIGGAAVGGAILGAIIGGGKGAAHRRRDRRRWRHCRRDGRAIATPRRCAGRIVTARSRRRSDTCRTGMESEVENQEMHVSRFRRYPDS